VHRQVAAVAELFHVLLIAAGVILGLGAAALVGLLALLPLYDRHAGRKLACPGHGEGATAGAGFPHNERAGDRLDRR
jgi:hypothetical protein